MSGNDVEYIDEAQPQNHATLNIDFSGVPGTWALAYLCLPEKDRDLARRATALNLITSADGLPKDWEAQFARVLLALSGDAEAQQAPPPRGFKPRLAVDNDKPAA